jgi:3-isopropylmalate dehydrogenase
MLPIGRELPAFISSGQFAIDEEMAMGKTYKIAVIPGDGTGPEVVDEGRKALAAAADKFGFKLELTDFDFGGDRYLRTGELLPDDSAWMHLKQIRCIYLGAIGHPDVKPGILEKGILLRCASNWISTSTCAPCACTRVETPLKDKGPEDIDYAVVRENSGGIYTGTGGISMKGTPQEVAVQSMVYNRFQVERCLRYAFEYTRKFGKKARGKGDANTLGLVGKTNVLTYVFDLWERAFSMRSVRRTTPMSSRDYYHVDATCMWMVKSPEWFDVLVTSNMFGDIITDLGADHPGRDGHRRGRQHQSRRA